jgi:prepilin-type N-terminal cleavage/methylation domain-containing protein
MVQIGLTPTAGGREPGERVSGDGGFTLVETLISLTILATLVILVVGGMSTLVISSVLSRNQGNVNSVLKRAAEDVRGAAYVSCNTFTGAAPYSFPSIPAAASIPENQSSDNKETAVVDRPVINRITTFSGQTVLWTNAGGANTPGCTTANASGPQMVEIATESADGDITAKILVTKANT